MIREPRHIWWSADEIATAALPDMPSVKRRVNEFVNRCEWRGHPEFARRRAGRGGGWEYHYALFPLAAQRKLLAETAAPVEDVKRSRADAWSQFDQLKDKVKDKARARLEILRSLEAMEEGGVSRDLAVAEISAHHGGTPSPRTIWNWLSLVEGVDRDDWLAYLPPGHSIARRAVNTVDCDPEFWAMLVSAYLRLAKPTFTQSWRASVAWAKQKGLPYLAEQTARRKLERDVPRTVQILKREGPDGLARAFPPQIRDRSGMHALEMVVADCHKIDVFVEWPDGTINRPQIVAFQDVYSAKIVSWRVDHDPNKVAVMAAFGDLVEDYGIPKMCLFDNGREFANKWMTGGSPTRFRFKIRDDEPLGVLPLLGIKVLWARPGHGQAKPIERTFRDLASDVAKDPRFDGAYVGHKTDAKPADYGSRAIPSDEFLRVLEQGIEEHNARPNRTGQTAIGRTGIERSFNAVFTESYKRAPIRKATDEQRRLWLMGQEERKLHKENARLSLQGNFYYANWMVEHAGKTVVARFNPEDLHEGLWLYTKAGEYLGFTPCQERVGFVDMVEAKAHAKRQGQIRRAEKQLAKLHTPLAPAAVGQRMDDTAAARAPAEPLDAKVVSPTFGQRAARLKPIEDTPVENPDLEARRDAMVLDMRANEAAPKPTRNTDRERFAEAMDIEARIKSGAHVGSAEIEWHASYQQSAEYRAQSRLRREFGQDLKG